MTGSIPRRPLQSHYLVCIENYLFIIEIEPIYDKYLKYFFDMFLLYVCLIKTGIITIS